MSRQAVGRLQINGTFDGLSSSPKGKKGLGRNHQPTAIDMFAGAGGMSLGLEKAGFRVIYANEVNRDAAETYHRNFPHVNLERRDVREIDAKYVQKKLAIRDVDLIVAGPPCQGFSVAGRRNPKDRRNRLFEEVLRFVEVFQPKIVVIENVVGMLSMAGGKVVAEITNNLRELGYFPHIRKLRASNYGVPQNRERIFIISCTLDIPEQELFPAPVARRISVEEALSDLEFLGVNEKALGYVCSPASAYQKLMRQNAPSIIHNHESSNHSLSIQRRFNRILPGQNGSDVLDASETGKHTYFRLDPGKPSRTLTTLPEDFIHYSKNRTPTVREMARIQSFPDDFIFCGPRTTGGRGRKVSCPQYTQVGNAVPPLMAEAVFRTLNSVIGRHYRSTGLAG